MSYAENPYRSPLGVFAAEAAADERSAFITKTYAHLAGAIGLFVALEALLLRSHVADNLIPMMIGTHYGWLVVLGLFMLVSYVAQSWAQSSVSPATQYMGLGLYVVAEAVIFLPLLYVAERVAPGVIPSAAITTLGAFRRPDGHRLHYPQGFFLPADRARLWRAGGDGSHRGRDRLQIRLGADLHLCHDRLGVRLHSLPHVERDAPLPHRPARGGGVGAVRLGGAVVLVHPATVPLAARVRRTRPWEPERGAFRKSTSQDYMVGALTGAPRPA